MVLLDTNTTKGYTQLQIMPSHAIARRGKFHVIFHISFNKAADNWFLENIPRKTRMGFKNAIQRTASLVSQTVLFVCKIAKCLIVCGKRTDNLKEKGCYQHRISSNLRINCSRKKEFSAPSRELRERRPRGRDNLFIRWQAFSKPKATYAWDEPNYFVSLRFVEGTTSHHPEYKEARRASHSVALRRRVYRSGFRLPVDKKKNVALMNKSVQFFHVLSKGHCGELEG